MSFLKKIWKQRIVEYPGRRRLDDTSQPEVYDVSRAEGNVMQEGDGFTAANMNDLEERIEAGIEDMSPKEGTISTFPIPGTPGVFYVDIETNLIYRWDETVEEYVQVGGGKSEAEGMISDAFSETKDYASGDYTIYSNTLYRFTSAKPAGAWDAGAVEATTVAGELSELNGNMTWKFAGETTGKNILALPNAAEYIVIISVSVFSFSIHIPSIFLSETGKQFRTGYAYSTENLMGVSVNISSGSVSLNSVAGSSGDRTAEAKLHLYCR